MKQQRLKDALAAARIPYTLGQMDGHEVITWDLKHAEAVDRIQVALFGEPLPSGTNIHYEGRLQQEFKDWLTANKIPFRAVIKDDREYIAWAPADCERVVEWRYFPKDNPMLACATVDRSKEPAANTNPR